MSKIGRFKLSDIFEAENNASLSTDIFSQQKYSLFLTSSFEVLSDQKTIIGVLCNSYNLNIIQRENIENHNESLKIQYKANNSDVNALIVDESRDTLLAGEGNKGQGKVVQYNLSSGEMIKDYGPIGIGKVLCGARMNNFVFFGGVSGNLRIIDTISKELIMEPIETCIGDVYDLEVCLIDDEEDAKVLISVDGRDQEKDDVNQEKTDCFDITNLVPLTEPSQEDRFARVLMKKQIGDSNELMMLMEKKIDELEEDKAELIKLIEEQQNNLENQEKTNMQIGKQMQVDKEQYEVNFSHFKDKLLEETKNAKAMEEKLLNQLNSKENEINLIKNQFDVLVEKLKNLEKNLKDEQKKTSKTLTYLESEKEINNKTLLKLTEDFKKKENDLQKNLELIYEENKLLSQENPKLKEQIKNYEEAINLLEIRNKKNSLDNEEQIHKLEFQNKVLESQVENLQNELTWKREEEQKPNENELSLEQMKKDNQYLIQAFEENEIKLQSELKRFRELQSKYDNMLIQKDKEIVKIQGKLEQTNSLWKQDRHEHFKKCHSNNSLIEDLRRDNLKILKIVNNLQKQHPVQDEHETHIYHQQAKGGISNLLMERIDCLFELYSDIWRKMEYKDQLRQGDMVKVKSVLRKIYELSLDRYGFGHLK
jgi:hypothetical protein